MHGQQSQPLIALHRVDAQVTELANTPCPKTLLAAYTPREETPPFGRKGRGA